MNGRKDTKICHVHRSVSNPVKFRSLRAVCTGEGSKAVALLRGKVGVFTGMNGPKDRQWPGTVCLSPPCEFTFPIWHTERTRDSCTPLGESSWSQKRAPQRKTCLCLVSSWDQDDILYVAAALFHSTQHFAVLWGIVLRAPATAAPCNRASIPVEPPSFRQLLH